MKRICRWTDSRSKTTASSAGSSPSLARRRSPAGREENSARRSVRTSQLCRLVRMLTATYVVFGIISAFDIPLPSQDPDQSELEIAEIELVGEAVERAVERRHFCRGISIFPVLGRACSRDPERSRAGYAARSAATARIGAVHEDRSLPAFHPDRRVAWQAHRRAQQHRPGQILWGGADPPNDLGAYPEGPCAARYR